MIKNYAHKFIIFTMFIFLGFILFIIFPRFGGKLFLHILVLVSLNVILASSYRIFYIAGMGSMCHITFYAIGAYTSALFSIRLGLPWIVGFISGGLIAAFFAALISLCAVRSKGAYFFLVTFGFFIVIDSVIAHWNNLTGGRDGIRGIPKIMGINNLTLYYYIAISFCILTVFVMYRIATSRMGFDLLVIGDSDTLSEAIGINVVRYKVISFTLGGLIAGMAGSLYAHYMGFISPTSFGFWQSIYILIWVIIGGERRVWGPIFGAIIMSILAEGLRMTGKIQALVYVVALLIVIMVMPHGIVGLIDSLRAKLGKSEQSVKEIKLGREFVITNKITSKQFGTRNGTT